MTLIRIESTFTIILGPGKVDLGDLNVSKVTVRDIKHLIQKQADVPADLQSLWWEGYILDQDDATLLQACVGVNGEVIRESDSTLVLFMTIPEESHMQEEKPTLVRPSRTSSIDRFLGQDLSKSSMTRTCVIS
jgi:Ubiquitin family